MAYGAPPPVYGPPTGPAPAPYGTPPPASPPPMAPPPVAPVPVAVVPPPVKSKPDGIMLIAALEFVYAFLMLAYAGLFIWIGMVVMAAAHSTGSSVVGGLGDAIGGLCIAFGVIYILFAVIFIVLAWGMMNLKPWARKFTIILMIISILLNLGGLGSSNVAAMGIAVVEILLAIVILIYLFKPSIKAAFEPPAIVAGPGPIMVGGQMPPAYGPPPPMYPPQQPPGYGPPPPQAPPPY
jgi:hypothetical protein